MTVILGLIAGRCAILASDSRVSAGASALQAAKIFPYGDRGMWAAAGDSGAAGDLATELGVPPNRALSTAGFGRSVRGIQRRRAADFVPTPGGSTAAATSTFVAAGVDEDGEPWMTEVSGQGEQTDLADVGRNAIGSGRHAALAALEALHPADGPPLAASEAALAAYLAVSAAIRVSAAWVGGQVQLWVAAPGQDARCYTGHSRLSAASASFAARQDYALRDLASIAFPHLDQAQGPRLVDECA